MRHFITWLSKLLANPTLAAWLQAFAAMVALGISVWATWRVGAVERRRDRLQARGIAVAVYPELLKLQIAIAEKPQALANYRDAAAYQAGQFVAADVTAIARLDLPPMIERNIDQLYLLEGLAGPSCLQLVGMLSQYNQFVDEFGSCMMTMAAGQWGSGIPHLMEHLDLLDKIVAKCEGEVRPIHDAIKG